jgi:opacity protein-like surface antigen
MRLCVVGAALLFSIATTGAAQSRWTISAGPEWQNWWGTRLWGVGLRAEYDLTNPTSVFGLRLEGGARWGPTQGYFYSQQSPRFSLGGTEQPMDLLLGFSGGLSPWPRERFSPYVTMGIFGRQTWRQGSHFFSDSLSGKSNSNFSYSHGDIIATLGVGLRARLAGRSFQLELRRIREHNGLSFGTRLPF